MGQVRQVSAAVLGDSGARGKGVHRAGTMIQRQEASGGDIWRTKTGGGGVGITCD